MKERLSFLKKFTRREKETNVAPEDSILLPYSVLQNIKLNPGGVIGKSDIQRLVRDGENRPTAFSNAALSVLLKAVVSNPDAQESIIKDVAGSLQDVATSDAEGARRRIRDIVEEHLKTMPEEQTVSGGKLKRLNLGGFHQWDARYAKVAERLAMDRRNVFVVAHSTLVGLSSYVRSFRDANKDIHILIPQNLPEDPVATPNQYHTANRPAGYTIHPNGDVETFGKDFIRPKNALIVDDLRDKGRTEEKIRLFWMLRSDEEPTFEPIEVVQGVL